MIHPILRLYIQLQGLECLSNGILRDQRVFHIKDQKYSILRLSAATIRDELTNGE